MKTLHFVIIFYRKAIDILVNIGYNISIVNKLKDLIKGYGVMLKKLVCVLFLVLSYSVTSEAIGVNLSKEVGSKVKCSCDHTFQINTDFTDGEVVFESSYMVDCHKVQINTDFTDGEIVYEYSGICSHKCNINYMLKNTIVNDINK